ncbi:MAG: T9SS type A sorting domain-containing protein [Bacteroidota bacterium]|nr:T9SS type A sorting domain-containing protein [Bacteroidota bacterium]
MKTIINLFLSACFLMLCGIIQAQPATMLPFQDGDAVATCFSGNSMGQNLSMPVIVVMNIQNANINAPIGANWSYAGLRLMDNQWAAQHIGEVFGIATSNSGDIFVTATTVYGGPTATTNYAWGTLPGAGPGTVYKINGITGAPSVFANLPNTSAPGKPYAALGNICYDGKHNQFFVTDLDDGKIYRLDGTTGAILSSFDPFAPDGGTPGYCPLGERLWGIGYFNDSVYFCRWNQDGGNTGGLANQIWSVGLSGTGNFAGPEHLDFNIPPLAGSGFSHPVSDIEFSQSGNMLLAERVWYGTAASPLLPTPNLGGWAHAARLLEYHLVGGTWTAFPTSKYQVGTFYNQTNSSGGCDYGFKSYDDKARAVAGCDSTVWVSGDALHFNTPGPDPEIYGFQGYPQVAGPAASTAALSMFIDANNVTNDVDKNEIGDIDIYKHCGVQGCLQHSIVAKPLAGNGTKECCYQLKITDSLGGYTSLSAEVMDPLVMITGIGTTGLVGWGTSNTGMVGTWTPPGGVIPTGSTNGLILCLTTLGPPPIVVVFTWYGKDGTRCVDTMRFDCARVPPPFPPCVTIDSSKVLCATTGPNGSTFSWTFTFTNNSPFSCPPYNQPAQNLSISSATMGVVVTPASQALVPPVGCAGVSAPITVSISGMDAMPGEAVCIVFHLRGALVDSAGNCVWSCPCDTVCLTLPKCHDCCDGFKKVIALNGLSQTATTNLNVATTAAPAPVIKATATIVSAEIKRNPGSHCAATGWTPVAGYFLTPAPTWSGLPLVAPMSPAPMQLVYGTNPGGVSMAAAPLALVMHFPPPPSSIYGCTDSLMFCIRYSFTDTNCVTCDTEVCYSMLRGGKIVVGNGGSVPDTLNLAVGLPIGTEKGTPVILDPSIPRFGSLKMTDQSTGSLLISVPTLIPQGGVAENEITVVGIALKASSGVRVASLGGTPAVDEVGQVKATIAPGTQKSFAVIFDNYTKQNSFTCDLGVQFVLAGNPRDTLEAGERITARVPGTPGGDSLDIDKVTPRPSHVTTYALHLSNGNKMASAIDRVIVGVTGQATILAVGPSQDSQKTVISLAKDRTGRDYVFQLATDDHIRLYAGESFRPIYLTVADGSGRPTVLHYKTIDADNNVLTDDSLILTDPLSIVKNQDPAGSKQPSTYLLPPFPNPAATMTSIQVHLDNSDVITISVHDALGKEVGRVVTNERVNSGDNVFVFGTNELPSGTYFVTLTSSSGSDTKSFSVVR